VLQLRLEMEELADDAGLQELADDARVCKETMEAMGMLDK